MRNFLILAASATAMLGAPAAAQWAPGPWNPSTFWRGAPANPYDRIQFLQDRVNRGFADGSLDRREAARINRELNGVRQWIGRMHWQTGHLTPDQRARAVRDWTTSAARSVGYVTTTDNSRIENYILHRAV